MKTDKTRINTTPKTSYTDYLTGLFLASACLLLPTASRSEAVSAFGIVFISIVLEAAPFMLAGALVGGLIEAFVSRERMASLLPRTGWGTVCAAAGAGILFPVCECAVVPVVRRLVGKGLPAPAAVAYLLAGPIVNPVVAASTAMAYGFDWRVVACRVAFGYGIAVAVGVTMGCLFPEDGMLLPENRDAETHHGCACGCGALHSAPLRWPGKLWGALRHAGTDFLDVGHYLVIGAFIAALAQTWVDRAAFTGLAATPGLSISVMVLLAVGLNLCSEADAFVAASFQGLMPFPAQMAFMLTGPMLDIKLLLMYRRLFKPRAIVALALMVLASVLVVSLSLEGSGGLG